MKTKVELREIAKKIRFSIDVEKTSEKIVKKVLNWDIYKEAKHIMIFYPIGHEINLLKLLKNIKKSFYLPRVNGKELLVCPYEEGDELVLSKFKTQEPISAPINPEILDLIFVPALMVDKNNHRLGYGGGFYDRFLSKNAKNAKKIVAIPNDLIIDELPSESFDAKIDVTICDN